MIPDSAGCTRRLYRKVHPLLQEAVHAKGAKSDRYRKHFKAISHMWLLILHMMHSAPSLRQSHARMSANPTLSRRLAMPKWISLSQLARSSTSRKPECFEQLLAQLTTLVKRTPRVCRDRECKDPDCKH